MIRPRIQKGECIYPVKPFDLGSVHVLVNGYEGVVTDSTSDVAYNTAEAYFASLTEEESQQLGLHPALTEREDFLQGVLSMTRILAGEAEYRKDPSRYAEMWSWAIQMEAQFSAE